MSWRDVAKRALKRDAHDDEGGLQQAGDAGAYVSEPPPPDVDDYDRDERNAIATVDGGLPESWAAALQAIERGARPAGISERDWRKSLDQLWSRADAHGLAFVAAGWTFEEVFGVGAHWMRLDQRGAAWFAPTSRIVEITPERIVYERQAGERSTHRKPARVN